MPTLVVGSMKGLLVGRGPTLVAWSAKPWVTAASTADAVHSEMPRGPDSRHPISPGHSGAAAVPDFAGGRSGGIPGDATAAIDRQEVARIMTAAHCQAHGPESGFSPTTPN